MDNYTIRRTYADKYVHSQREILSTHFKCSPDQIAIASNELDCQYATDYLAPTGERIAARVRRAEQRQKYYGQFTIRTSKGRQGLSELDKVLRGDVQFMLYGFADPTESRLDAWWLLDLAAVIEAAKDDWSCSPEPQAIAVNGAEFIALTIDGFLSIPPLVVAGNQQPPRCSDCTGCQRLLNARIGRMWEGIAWRSRWRL